MARGDFYKCDYVYAKVPELKKFIPPSVMNIGLSNAGNIKYIVDGTIVSIPKANVPYDVLRRFSDLFSDNTTKPQNSTPVNFRIEELPAIIPNYRLPKNIEEELIIKNSKEGARAYYLTLPVMGGSKKKSKRTKEIQFKYPTTNPILAEIILDTHNDKEKREKTYQTISDNLLRIKDFYPLLPQNDILKIEIIKDTPCLYLETQSPHIKKSPVMIRMDATITTKDIEEQVDKIQKSVVKKYNEKTYDSYLDTIRTAIIKETENILKTKLDKVSYKDDKTKILFTAVDSACVITTELTFNLDIPEGATEKTTDENGIINYRPTEICENYIKATAKNNVKKMMKSNWTPNPSHAAVRNIKSEMDRIQNSYTKTHNRVLSGPAIISKKVSVAYKMNEKVFYVKNNFAKITIDQEGKMTIKKTPVYTETLKEATLKRRQSAIDFFKEKTKDLDIEYKKGKGVLYGTTTVLVDGLDYEWKTTSYRDSLVDWKKQTERNIKEIRQDIQKKKDEERAQKEKALKGILGSMLAKDIAVFINANAGYITQNATVNYLRGLQKTFGGTITGTDSAGRYKPLSSDDVDKMIDRMIRANVFCQKELKGTYGRFYILRPTNLADDIIHWQPAEIKEKEVKKKLQSALNDYEAEQCFNFLKKKDTAEAKTQILSLITAKGFVCNHYAEYVDALKTSDEDFRVLLKMKKEMTEDAFEKKVLITALKK